VLQRAVALLLLAVLTTETLLALAQHWYSPLSSHVHILFGPLQPGWERHPHPNLWGAGSTEPGTLPDGPPDRTGSHVLSLYRLPGADGAILSIGIILLAAGIELIYRDYVAWRVRLMQPLVQGQVPLPLERPPRDSIPFRPVAKFA
jgi:hypothetical protein